MDAIREHEEEDEQEEEEEEISKKEHQTTTQKMKQLQEWIGSLQVRLVSNEGKDEEEKDQDNNNDNDEQSQEADDIINSSTTTLEVPHFKSSSTLLYAMGLKIRATRNRSNNITTAGS
jgi:hypothetical protein